MDTSRKNKRKHHHHYHSDKSFVPSLINKQNKIVDPIDINNNEEIVITITIDIPLEWIKYDIILSGSLFADGTDTNCGVVMSFYNGHSMKDKYLIGSQIIGHNNTDHQNGIGFAGYHKEILNNQSKTGKVKFCMSAKCIDTLFDRSSDISIINRYIYVQGVRQ